MLNPTLALLLVCFSFISLFLTARLTMKSSPLLQPNQLLFSTPSHIDRLKNEAVLDRMNHKLNYRRNPKNNPDTIKDLLVRNSKNFSSSPHGEQGGQLSQGSSQGDPSAGVGGSQIHRSVGNSAVGTESGGSGAVTETSSQLKKKYGKRTAADAAAEAGVQLMPLFVAEPSVILFSHYEIGDVITQSILFRNISTIQRTIRVIPPGSGFFSMGPVLYPSGSHAGSVAAGIPVRSEITFYPNSLGESESDD